MTATTLLAVIRAYRRIPVRLRSVLPGTGTSAAALAAVAAGGGWSAFWHYALPRRVQSLDKRLMPELAWIVGPEGA